MEHTCARIVSDRKTDSLKVVLTQVSTMSLYNQIDQFFDVHKLIINTVLILSEHI